MIVLDANILIRAVLGQRVGQLLDHYSQQGIQFYAPETAYAEAEESSGNPTEFLRLRRGLGWRS